MVAGVSALVGGRRRRRPHGQDVQLRVGVSRVSLVIIVPTRGHGDVQSANVNLEENE